MIKSSNFLIKDKRLIIVAFIFLLALQTSWAQSVLTGSISSDNGDLLPGVTIVEKGTTNGTTTDTNGNFSLNLLSNNAMLVVSYIGYVTQEVNIGNRTTIKILLQPDAKSLEEVVVVGYGTVKKSDVTGSVISLQPEDLNKGLNTSVDQLLQGRAPGVQVTQSSSEPGGGVSIRIRGTSSINAGNEPLYVIDGLLIDNAPPVSNNGTEFGGNPPPRNPLSALNPADIQSIEILKDASATAIYGSRGANGVVLITTKRGADGKMKVDYNLSLAASQIARKLDILNTAEYIQVMNDLAVARGNKPVFSDNNIQEIGAGTDWQDQVLRQAITQNHNLSLSGGSGKTRYYTSFNYTNQEGIIINSQFERFQGRINLEHQASDKFKFGLNLNTSRLLNDYVPVNGFGINQQADLLNAALNTPPIFKVFDENGSYIRPENGLNVSVTLDNPLALANGTLGEEKTNRTFGNIYGEYNILPDLVFRLNFGTDRSNSRRDIYRSTITNVGLASKGIATIATGELSNYLIEGTFNYKKNIGQKHDFNVLAGYTFQQFDDLEFAGSIRGFASDIIKTNNLALGNTDLDDLSSNSVTRTLSSYLGRVNYSYKDKYLLTASVRADGSSNFGQNNRFGVFPSFSFAWKLTNEPFLSQTNLFSDLKLRIGWGQIGNDDIGAARALSTYSRVNDRLSGAVFGNNLVTSVSAARIPNPDLKWETSEQVNVGLDYGLLAGRLNSSIDIFRKTTRDLLLELPIPQATGFSFVTTNIGEIRNSGVELLLSSKNLVGNFKWNTTINFATLKNEVISLGPIAEIIRSTAGINAIARPGDPLFAYYGYQAEGIFQSADEIANSAQKGIAEPGVPRWKDVNQDGQITGEDRVVLGKPFPDFTFGLSNDFAYKKFSLNIFVEGVQGVDLFYWGLVDALYANDPYRNRLAEPLLNRWTLQNFTNQWPSGINDTKYQGDWNNSFTVVDASFIRLKNIQLTYQIPFKSAGFIRNASVSLAGQNLALITDYPGFDPDVNSTGTGNVRLDRNAYPASRTVVLGINVGF